MVASELGGSLVVLVDALLDRRERVRLVLAQAACAGNLIVPKLETVVGRRRRGVEDAEYLLGVRMGCERQPCRLNVPGRPYVWPVDRPQVVIPSRREDTTARFSHASSPTSSRNRS